jgi:hypothetical protein
MVSTQKSSAFERRFEAAARRVLKRRGVPDSRMNAETASLRKVAPSFDLRTVAELEQQL